MESLSLWRLWFVGSDVIYNRVEYLATGLDCRVIFIDHLSILISGWWWWTQNYWQDNDATSFTSWTTQVSMFLVSHLRRTQTDQNHKKVHGPQLDNYVDRQRLLNSQIWSSDLNEINRPTLLELQRLCDSLRIVKRGNWPVGTLEYDLNTCRFNETTASTISKKTEPPTSDAVNRAKFIDRTYVWKGAKQDKKTDSFNRYIGECPAAALMKQSVNHVSKKQDLGLDTAHVNRGSEVCCCGWGAS